MEKMNTEQRVAARRGGSRAGLFLIELMIAILFFALASAVCMQLFARAHLIARESRDLGEAVNRAQTAAEYFKAASGSPQRFAELLNLPEGRRIEIYYDKNWQRLDGAEGDYRLTVELPDGDAPLATAQIRVEGLRPGGQAKEICSLQVAKYRPGQG